MNKEQPLLIADNICMSFGSRKSKLSVLKNISFELNKGEFLCIVGPNGSGKTTLIQILAGFLKPSTGSISINGKLILKPGPDHPVILQDLWLFTWMSVWDNMMFGLKTTSSSNTKLVKRWLRKLGLLSFKECYPFELSGGMQQKLAIGRALVLNPKILLMDEPFSNLDFQTREKLQEEILSLTHSTGKTVVMVTHDLDEACYLADKILVLSKRPGRIKKLVKVSTKYPRKKSYRVSTRFVKVKKKIWNLLSNK